MPFLFNGAFGRNYNQFNPYMRNNSFFHGGQRLPQLMPPYRPFDEKQTDINNAEAAFENKSITDFKPENESKQNSDNTADFNKMAVKACFDSYLQNEKNSAVFYDNLAKNCSCEKNKKRLYQISKACENELRSGKTFYKAAFSEDCAVEDKKINISIGFKEGIDWAVDEESRGIEEICDVIEGADVQNYNRLMTMLIRKMKRLNILQLIYMESENQS